MAMTQMMPTAQRTGGWRVWGQLSVSTSAQQQGCVTRCHLRLPAPTYPGACPSASTDRTSSPALGAGSLPVSPVPPTCLHGPTCQGAWEGGACPPPHVGDLLPSPPLCTHPPWGPAKLPLRLAVSWPLACQLGQKPLPSPLSPQPSTLRASTCQRGPSQDPHSGKAPPSFQLPHQNCPAIHPPRPPSSRQAPYSPRLGLPFRSQNPHLHPALFTSTLPSPRALEVALLLLPPSSASSCPAPGSATLT